MNGLIMLTVSALVSWTSFAGPGHGHSHEPIGHGHNHSHGGNLISQEKTIELGKFHIERLIKKDKIVDSWSKAIYSSSIKKNFGDRTEWVVTFKNESGEKDKTTLYIFLSLNGKFIAANFTGK